MNSAVGRQKSLSLYPGTVNLFLKYSVTVNFSIYSPALVKRVTVLKGFYIPQYLPGITYLQCAMGLDAVPMLLAVFC